MINACFHDEGFYCCQAKFTKSKTKVELCGQRKNVALHLLKLVTIKKACFHDESVLLKLVMNKACFHDQSILL